MSIYITNDERYLLSHVDGGRFDVENRQAIFDHASPMIIASLLALYGPEESLMRLDKIIAHIEKRRTNARSRLKKYELACFSGWVQNMKAQIEGRYYGASANRPKTFTEGVMAILRRRASRGSN
jgi:hypothetical protein